VVLDVDVFELRGSHVVGSKSDAALVVLKYGSRANDGKTNDGKKMKSNKINYKEFVQVELLYLFNLSNLQKIVMIKMINKKRF
jgi:hypothetical protein